MVIFTWLLIFPIFELAYVDSMVINNYMMPEYSVEATVGAEFVAFDFVYLKAGSVNYQQYESIDVWKPYLTDYKIETGLRYNGLEIGYYHECRHTVNSSVGIGRFGGGTTKYFIRYGGKL